MRHEISSSLAKKVVRPADDVHLGSYIVVFKENTTDAHFSSFITVLQKSFSVELVHTYTFVFKGFAAKLNKAQLLAVRSHPQVDFVEEDQVT